MFRVQQTEKSLRFSTFPVLAWSVRSFESYRPAAKRTEGVNEEALLPGVNR